MRFHENFKSVRAKISETSHGNRDFFTGLETLAKYPETFFYPIDFYKGNLSNELDENFAPQVRADKIHIIPWDLLVCDHKPMVKCVCGSR